MPTRNPKSPFEFRSSLLTVFLLLIFLVIIARLFDLQVLKGPLLRREAESSA